MANYNRITVNDKVVIDLTQDTITKEKVPSGLTFHDKSGAKQTGTMTAQGEKTVIPSTSTQTAVPSGVYTTGAITVAPIPSDYIIPNGTLDITENGTYNVTEYASVSVNVESGGGGSSEDLNAILTEQENLIAELQETLRNKMAERDSDLPEGYHQVDFIEFNGKQLVDLKILGNQDTRIRTSFTWGSATQNHIFGCASPDNKASITSFMNGSWRFGDQSFTKSITKNSNILPYEVLMDKTTIGVTGSISTCGDVNEFETISTLLLGGARNSEGGMPNGGIIGRIFYFKLWGGDILILDLIPVTNGTVYRFWDRVSRIFFDSMTDTPLEGGNL
jgi:hypothetical protein